MPFKHSVDKDNQIVMLTSYGNQFAEEARIETQHALNTARKHGFHKFLVDLQQAIVNDTIMESYNFIGSLPAIGFNNKDKIAAVANADAEQESSRHRFSETLAINRGLNVKLFYNITDAVQWLNED